MNFLETAGTSAMPGELQRKGTGGIIDMVTLGGFP